ncbi:MAG: hypothetical protein ACXAD7_10735, partial [Candidatus Kariarchaeaceae archaeon]
YLNENEKRIPLVRTLAQIYDKFALDATIDYNDRIMYLERTIKLFHDIQDTEKENIYTVRLAELIENNTNNILNSSGFDQEFVAAHKLVEAAKLYLRAGIKKKHDELLDKSKELYPAIEI